MKWKHYYLVVGVITLGLLTLLPTRQVPATAAGPTVSSYGHMQTTSSDGKAVVLPLRATAVKAEVVGVMSSVTVAQHFHNPYKRPIEAVYVFPLPQHAAVHAMTMHVGQRSITAVIRKRAEARAIYERAKQQGKTASLLEQERPNIFTQSVANIMPGDQIRVELRYVEELAPRDGEYEFVFPMVVGPRYMGEGRPLGKAGTGWAEDNDRTPDASRISPTLLAPGTRPGHDISVELRLNAGVAIGDLRAPTHKVTLQRPASDLAIVELDRGDRIPNRDFVVRYRLTGAKPRVTFLANREPARGGHFLLMVQPQRQVSGAAVAPREYVFVVDTSGSMDGVPISQVKKAMQRCLASLGSGDTFQIIRFAGSAERFAAAPLAATSENVRKALGFVDTLAGGGGTEFIPALELALKAPRDPKRSRIVAFMTDGYIGYESEVMKYVRDNGSGANIFAFGVGSSVNRYLIDGLARIGQGEPFVLLGRDGEEAVIKRFFEMVSRPALTNVSVDWGTLPVSDVTPRQPPDLFADRPVVLAGRFSAGGSGTVTVRGLLAGVAFEQKVPVTLPDATSTSNPALSYLWARRTIGELMDRFDTDPEARNPAQRRVTELALQYSLMSKWTSFVAVDRVVRNVGGEQDTAAVPVPLPEGVSEKAAPRAAYAALSQDQFAPGDPEVIISAPDATAVTLIFPTGEIKACTKHPITGKWIASFLIPEDTRDGVYAVRVVMTLRGGEQVTRTVRYQVDGREPKVRLELSARTVLPGGRVQLTLWPEALGSSPPLPSMRHADSDIGDPSFAARVMQDIARAEALLPSGETIALQRQADGAYRASFDAPITEGRYPVRVVVRDAARNKARHTLWITVAQP
jgi:Ca-activated chloride channel family protein